jgi:hypothetical protein
MIAFNKENGDGDDADPKKIEKTIKKLQDLLDDLYESELEIEEEDYLDIDMSDLISLVYEVLFQEKYNYMNLSLMKNQNNSLSLKIESIK